MFRSALLGGLVLALGATEPALASIVTTANPNVASEIGARIRWGATGFEASVYDASPLTQNPTLNPTGAPFWSVGTAYGFRVTYTSTTGTISLGVDFNRDDSFGAGEVISQSAFGAPGELSYAGLGFNFLSISGNESGSTGRSSVTNLAINGSAQSDIAPNGGFTEIFFRAANGAPLGEITITGEITFSTAGTGQERPAWDFRLRGPEDPSLIAAVPEPASLAVLGAGLLGLAALRRRRKVA